MAFVDQSKVRHLQGIAGQDITQSVLVGVLVDNHNDMEKATDEILTMNLELDEVQSQLEERKAQLQQMGREQMRKIQLLAEEEARWQAEKEAKEKAEAEAQAKKLAEIERVSREAEQKLAEDEAKLAEFYDYINKAEEQHVAAERQRIAAEQARIRANKDAEIAEVQKKLSEEKALMELAFAEQKAEAERRRLEFEEQQQMLQAEREAIQQERQRLEEIKNEADEALKRTQIKELKERKRRAEEKKRQKKERSRQRKLKAQRQKGEKKEEKEEKSQHKPRKVVAPPVDDLEDELTKEFENSQIIDTSREEAQVPKVMILLNKAAEQTEEGETEQKELLAFLEKYDVDVEADVKLVDVSHDAELAGFVHERVNENAETPVQIKYPYVCIHGRTVGQLSDLKRLAAAGQFRDLLNKEDVDLDVRVSGTGVYVGQGILDHCLDAAEYVASGVSSMLLLPVTLVTWPFRSGAANSTPEGIDFDVVHTNWYWRNLKRKFRFCEESFLRIHPRHNDVRATHAYDTVKTIRFADTTNISVEYNDGSATDYITATEQDCNQIVSIIQKHNPAAEVFSLHEL
eukprot:CAMPEP_0114605228 /NCGR_PEP_ID=MMETSP0168-20121206/950_1 /TAXON_ID=95228 ORGANISM="Vannella sp., Strain DIVA3 517/6/12" /NCGR_SAMPLE_ID=MMETSP0168 /ASSEMBLY_ACC=CAM_ASM_000044 /LENGTH=572 /DNA_ID=CAMNT_0001816079 /DNA_START=77 /DNA_END=1795 /DNA_ORIENTATION=-